MTNQIISGITRPYKSMADGTLRLQIDIEPNDASKAVELFGQIGTNVAIAVLNVDKAQEQSIIPQPKNDYSQGLYLSSFFRTPDVWKAVGSDKEFLEWLKTQDCFVRYIIFTGVYDSICDGDICANHVRRVANGAGTGIKPEYSAIPGCHKHHHLQSTKGESYFGGKEVFDKLRISYLHKWSWETLKGKLGYESWSLVPYAVLLQWATQNGVDKYLKQESEYGSFSKTTKEAD